METKARYIKAEEIYKNCLKSVLEKHHRGKIVAIEVNSKEYFVGSSEIEAFLKASRRYPDKTFCFLKVGEEAAGYIGRH